MTTGYLHAREGRTESDATEETQRQALARELCALICIGSYDELRAFGVIARRVMGKGRDSYGPTNLKTDRRDFKAEKADEKADWIWYDALDEVRENDERLERLRREAADEIATLLGAGATELGAAPLPPPPDTVYRRLDDLAQRLDEQRALSEELQREVNRQGRALRREFDVSDEEPTR